MKPATVTKRDLVEMIADKLPSIKRMHIADVVTALMTSIGDALVDDKRVELRDFGVFTSRNRDARMARNPRTGAPVPVAATKVCGFKVGKELKARLAASYKPPVAAE